MTCNELRRGYLLRASVVALVAAGFSDPASAAPANISGATANVLNLLSPFLSLNSSAIGQQTLQTNLQQAVNINQNTASVALLNGNLSTNALAALSISDENLLGAASNNVFGIATSQTFGPAANLAGGLPTQNTTSYNTTVNGAQPVGAFGSVLGAAYVAGVSPTATALPNTVALLVAAVNQTGNTLATGDSQEAKFFFANGTFNGTTPVVAPAGFTVPTFNGLPNTTNSVYDTAYNVSNTQANQNAFGDSHPYQTFIDIPGANYTLYDPTVKTATTAAGAVDPDKPSSNPAFPSSHMAYAMTDSILLGLLVPQLYQPMLERASQMGESRIVVGVHYPTDIIGSRAFVQYDLAQYLTNPAYINNAAVTGTAVNLPAMFGPAQSELQTYLTQAAASAGCGTSLATCITSAANTANDPYVPSVTNAQIYEARLTYGLPIMSFAQAPREQAPVGGPDASILLATVYGGSTSAAQTLAPTGGMTASLQTSTINQIIVNTETNALSAFFGNALSYWARINLYAADGYFQNVTGAINLAATDKVNTDVTVSGATTNVNGDVVPGGVLGGTGTINGNLTVQSGGAVAAVGNGTTTTALLTVNGTANLQAGSAVDLSGIFLPGKSYKVLSTTGAVTLDPNATVNTAASGNLMSLFTGRLSAVNNSGVSLTVTSNLASGGANGNQRAVASAIDGATNAANLSATGIALVNALIANNNSATAPATFSSLSGEGLADQAQTAFDADDLFARTVLSQTTYLRGNDTDGPTHLWSSGFGQSGSLDGDPGQGSAKLTSDTEGFVIGVDHHLTEDFIVGLAGGYSSSSASVSDRATTGTLKGTHVGLYGVDHIGEAAYLAGTVAYAHFDNKVNRTAFGLGAGNGENSSFDSNEWLGRVEGGYKIAADHANVTPFIGFQIAELDGDAFTEGGTGALAAGLAVASKTTDSDKSFLGVQIDGDHTLEDGTVFTPFARVSWEHEYNTDRGLTASLVALPGNSFTVYGAPAASNLARFSTGFNVSVAKNVAIFASFDGAVSGEGNAYDGTGGVKIFW